MQNSFSQIKRSKKNIFYSRTVIKYFPSPNFCLDNKIALVTFFFFFSLSSTQIHHPHMCFFRSKVGLDKNREKRAVGPLNGGEKFALNSVATVRRQIASSGGEERRNPTDVADGALEFRIVLATLSPTMAFCRPATWANLPGAQATLFRTWEISWCVALIIAHRRVSGIEI